MSGQKTIDADDAVIVTEPEMPAADPDATEEYFAKEHESGTGDPPPPPSEEPVSELETAIANAAERAPETEKGIAGSMKVGDRRFGVTATGEPVGAAHWLADSSSCGDLVMALPSSVLIEGRTAEAGGVAVDMTRFLDAVMAGAGEMEGLDGVAKAAALPKWAVSRLFGTFPALYAVYSEAMDQCVLAVEAAAFKAAVGMKVLKKRSFAKTRQLIDARGLPAKDENGKPVTVTDSAEESFESTLPPDPTLSRTILTSRMRGRYKDEGRTNQAVIINITGAEANL